MCGYSYGHLPGGVSVFVFFIKPKPRRSSFEHHHQSSGLGGMEKTAIQSCPFASTMGIPDFPQDDVEYLPVEDEDEDFKYLKDAIETIDLSSISCRIDYDENDDELIAKARRLGRKSGANDFRAEYIFGKCMDQKTCIWRGNRHSWSDASSGITWVGVHGNDSICVVTKAGVLDVTRVHGLLLFTTIEEVECVFRRTIISEMEDLADPSSKPLGMHDKSINKPFSVVSVVPDTNKVHDALGVVFEERKAVKYKLEYLHKKKTEEDSSEEESGDDTDTFIKNSMKRSRRRRRELGIHDTDGDEDNIWFLQDKLKMGAASPIKEAVQADECDEKGAIEFLEKKMKKSAEHFTLEETIKTAISAFQHLFNKNFKANEIEVSVMDPKYFVLACEAHLIDPYVNHLEENEIENYLSDMSESESEGSCSSAITKRLKCYA